MSLKEKMMSFFQQNPDEPKYDDDIADMVNKEYERRQAERRPFELQWRLNQEFINGNQHLNINARNNRLEEVPKLHWWQEREVFNQVATIHETRVSRLSRQKPLIKARPASSDESDISAAKISSMLLRSAWEDQQMDQSYSHLVTWVETAGTAFLKPIWDKNKGRIMTRELVPDEKNAAKMEEAQETEERIETDGYEDVLKEGFTEMEIREGEIDTAVVSPYEIYPDSNFRDDIRQVRSIIHARAYHIDDIENMYGIKIKPEEVDVMTMQQSTNGLSGVGYQAGGFRASVEKKKNQAVLKEYYERPSKRYPEGRFIVVAGDKTLYVGPLPYMIGDDGEPDLPFVRVVSLPKAGCFWGTSVVERCIPIQRRYNALRNRKAEYLNLVAIGQWVTAEGAVEDEDELNTAPGNIVHYKVGFPKPEPVSFPSLPSSFENEVQTLLSEFTAVSGVSELSRYSEAPSGVKSGVALSIANEQDDTRIGLTSGEIGTGVKQLGRYWIRLYRQFVQEPRVLRSIGANNEVEVKQWSTNDLRSDDIIIENSSALAETPAQRRQMVFDLMNTGLFNRPESNPFTEEGVQKIMELLEFGHWESGVQDDRRLQTSWARKENVRIVSGQPIQTNDFDDHEIHIQYHNRYRMSAEFEEIRQSPYGPQLEMMLQQHIQEHEMAIQQSMMMQMQQQAMMQQQQAGTEQPEGGDAGK